MPESDLQRQPSQSRFRGGALWPYIIGITGTLLGFGVRWALGYRNNDQPLLIVFLIPVIITAYLGGLLPGLFITALAGITTDLFIIAPLGFGIAEPANRVRWFSLLLAGVLFSVFSEALHRAWRKAKASQSLLSVTLASIGDAVITTNRNGTITFINSEAQRLTGYTIAQAIGKPLGEVFHIISRDNRVPLADPVRDVLAQNTLIPLASQALLVTHDQREIPVEGRGAPIRRGGEPMRGVVLIFRDCSERYAAELAAKEQLALQQKLSRILETAPAVICEYLLTPDGKVRMPYASPLIEEIYGFTPAQLAADATLLQQRIHPDDLEAFTKSISDSASSMQPWHHAFRVFSPQRGEIWIEGHAAPERDPDGSIHWYGFINDITKRKQEENSLRRWADAFEYCAHGISLGDPATNTLIAFNPAYARLHRKTAEQLRNCRILDLYPPDQHARIAGLLEEVDRTGKVQYETYFDGAGSSPVPVQMDLVSVRDTNGRLLYRVATAQDITARKASEAALRQSEAQMRSVVEALSEGLILCNLEGQLLHWNRAALEMHGYKDVDEVRRHLSDFLQTFRFETLDGKPLNFDQWPMSRILRGETLNNLELRVYRTDKDWNRIYRYGGGGVSDASGKPILFMLTLVDVTLEKRAEDALRQAKNAAEAASRAKDEFLAVLSHELRTPLTPVLLVASALEKDKRLPQEFLEDVGVIRANTQVEARLIDDLLDLTRITHGKLSLRSTQIDVHRQIERAILVCRDEVEERRQSLVVELNATHTRMEGDPQRVQQVIWNIVQNASKYTPASGRITIRTSNRKGPFLDRSHVSQPTYVVVNPTGALQADERIVIEIEDNGFGISRDAMPRIFDPFEQPHRRLQNGVGGIGLGLTITKAIVEAHHGWMIVQSGGKDQGTKFSISFAVENAESTKLSTASPAAETSPRRPADAPATRILLVEDHATTAHNLQRLLQSEGYHVTIAPDIASAKRLVETEPFEILLTDLGLPDGDGSELMEYVRSRGIPTRGIVLSGYGMETDLTRTRNAGFDTHLIKPVTADELFKALEQLDTVSSR